MKRFIALLTIILIIVVGINHYTDAETYRLSGTSIELTVPAEDTLRVVHQEVQGIITDVHGLQVSVQADSTLQEAITDSLTATHTKVETNRTNILGLQVSVQKDSTNVEDIKSNVDQSLSTTESNIRGSDSDDLKALSDQADALADSITDVHTKVELNKTNIQGLQASVQADSILLEVTNAIIDDLVTYLYGQTKVATTTEDLNQAAASYTLFTGTTADVILESLTLRNANVDCSDDSGGFTGISIQTDDTTATTFISQASGVKANLTAEAQISWTGAALIKTGTIVTLTIYGAAADATCSPDIVAVYRSVGTGTGTLE